MVITKNLIMLSLLTTLIIGCSSNRSQPTNTPITNDVGAVENETVYTHGLQCVGKQIEKSGQAGKVIVAIDNIKDKTVKDFDVSSLTQGASDMAMTALAKVGALEIIDRIPGENLGHVQISKNEPGKVVGDILPSHVFLAGAITEYNKDLRNRRWGFDFFRNLLDVGMSGSHNVINVAMDLRMVASQKGKILRNSKKEFLVLSLQNNIVTRSYKGDIFRTWSNVGGGGNVGFKINDPQHLAVREIIERGVLILVGKLFEVNWKKCDVKRMPPSIQPSEIKRIKNEPGLSRDPTLMPGVTAQATSKPADWSKSLIAKLEGKLATGTQRSLYFNIPKIKSKTANYFESQLLGALVGSSLFKPLDSVTDLPKSELDQMDIEDLRTRVESRPNFSIMAAFLDADSELSWRVSTLKSQVTVTVFLVDKSTVLTESVTFPSTALPNEVAQSLVESPDGLSSQTGILKKNADLMLDFVTTQGKAFVTYQKGEKARFLMRTNRAAYPYIFTLDYWRKEQTEQTGLTRLYPRFPGVQPERIDANEVWIFSNDLSRLESADRYMLWAIVSEKPIDFPEELSIEWLQAAESAERYKLWARASENPIESPEELSIEWLQAADKEKLVDQGAVDQGAGLGKLVRGKYTDMGIVIHAKESGS
jgi:curli biogenesis system outer membrane secretion channel CsgG